MTKRKRKRSLSSTVFALTSKLWKQLHEEEIAEKERQKQEKKEKAMKRKKNTKRESRKKGKVKDVKEVDAENWICLTCDESFFSDEDNNVDSKWVQCKSCKSTTHASCISLLHHNLFSFESKNTCVQNASLQSQIRVVIHSIYRPTEPTLR